MDDATIASRIQFAFTLTYHYLFPQLTMSLALLLVIFKTLYLWKGDERFNIAAHFWAKIFAITFVVGVVTGIPMEFQFGTNWARFSASTGAIIAQTLAMEGAFAFFLESAFLGIFLFGERTFGPRMHWFSAVLVWLGTWLSGGFIIATNAWMQHPVGYRVGQDGKFILHDYWSVLFNSWIVPQYMHTISGSVITGSFVLAGLGAYYLLIKQHVEYGKMFCTIGVIVGFLASAFQIFPSGDLEGRQVADDQPAKLAAMEGLFHTEQGAGIAILGQPDMANQRLDNAFIVPKVLSILTYRSWKASVTGLDSIPRDQWPDNVPFVYFVYHMMVGLGTIFVAIMALALLLLWRKRLFDTPWVLWLLMLSMPFPFIANSAGWLTAELGRQPWLVYGLQRTTAGTSTMLSAGNVLFTLMGFAGVYLVLGLLYVMLVVQEAITGPRAEVIDPDQAEGLTGY
jgi:cytochrome bd ubiquinol oxidase subunit I